ncbi:MAG: sulfite exporter TauE/SafE family protein [Pseudomonadota bacterium]|nr:sulfite exporter TauE/SafE family protein [Pseudomonadota bacterium]
MNELDIAIMAAAIFFTSMLTTATGVGGGTLLIALMLQFMPPGVAIPVHGAVQTFANGWRVWLLRESLLWPIIIRFALPMPIGIAAGLWLFQELPKEWVQVLIGCFILLTLLSHGFRSFREKELPLWGFIPAGIVIGGLNIIIGVVGPVLSALLVGRDLTRQGVVSTISVFSMTGHVFKVIGFALVGFSFVEYWIAIVAMVLPIVLGTYVGRFLLGRMSDAFFRKLLRLVLTGLALKLVIWDGWMRGTL